MLSVELDLLLYIVCFTLFVWEKGGERRKEGRRGRRGRSGGGKRRDVGADYNRSRCIYSNLCFQFSLIFCVVFLLFC